MTQATQSRAPAPAPNAPANAQTLDQQIEKTVQDAVNQALEASQSGANGAEAGRLARDQVRDAMQRLRAQLDARRAGATPVVAQVPILPSEIIPPQVVDIVTAFFVTVAVIIIGFPLARAFARRLERRGQVAVSADSDVAPRLDRIEQAIEAVAIEVERVSEGQRYTTRLLSEMRQLPAPNPLEHRPSRVAEELEPIVQPAGERRP